MEFIDGMSLYRGYFGIGSADPLGMCFVGQDIDFTLIGRTATVPGDVGVEGFPTWAGQKTIDFPGIGTTYGVFGEGRTTADAHCASICAKGEVSEVSRTEVMFWTKAGPAFWEKMPMVSQIDLYVSTWTWYGIRWRRYQPIKLHLRDLVRYTCNCEPDTCTGWLWAPTFHIIEPNSHGIPDMVENHLIYEHTYWFRQGVVLVDIDSVAEIVVDTVEDAVTPKLPKR